MKGADSAEQIVCDVAEGRRDILELAEETLRRIRSAAPLGATTYVDPEAVLRGASAAQRAQGSLRGLPIVVKDNIHVAGMPNAAGTEALRNHVPSDHAGSVKALLEAGAFVVAKTNMHELAFGATSANAAFGDVRNPHDLDRFAGGSSGGTAALVAAGAVPSGLGTDTGGSVRIPSALTGVCGFRPSTGSYDGYGVTPLSTTRDTIGPIANTVRGCMILDDVLRTREFDIDEPAAGRIRLGIPRTYFVDDLDAWVRAAWDEVLAALETDGVELVPVDVDEIARIERRWGQTLVEYEAPRLLAEYLQEFAGGISVDELFSLVASPDVRVIIDRFSAVGEDDYIQCLRDRERMQREYAALFARERVHALAFPTTPRVAGRLDSSDTLGGDFSAFVRNTSPGSFSGLPGITMPIEVHPAALPVGFALDGPRGSDRALLHLAERLEPVVSGAIYSTGDKTSASCRPPRVARTR
ncbi:Asp-tRNA(Asn)/Glu-tRNA(Gln) amidotransferase A subunit family amidase [Microbacterium foliorum]|uniref:Asp-tRNA(Asn)/Glu-tRNA(Gln) amidotransferase A subunit family amidase n=1 Tax=Microbacterium foliorum TaxID=104336 RepID=A0ABU1HVJ2_9MICO|nr:amidase family protein [Microbacterium foliorum]MDR6144069.1 Asp-tRNA(Asn)/Glu-tRNA(Gln) amidotransferase A subunit family amidase [Microbacterium foliorum]